mgnify:CR=1 FL=1
MNVKNLLFAASAALAVSLQAEVTANNTLCRIEVESAAKSVIVAVPLAQVGDGKDIKVTDYILTTNLQKGDSILKWNDKSWDGWTIDDKGAWQAVTSVSGIGNVSETEPAADSALARGEAVWLNRSQATINDSKSFFLYGQVVAGETTLTAQAGAFTLLGNPGTTALDLSNVTWKDCADGDNITWNDNDGNRRFVVYHDGKWCTMSTTVTDGFPTTTFDELKKDTAVIPVGVGFWYKSTGTTSPSATIK